MQRRCLKLMRIGIGIILALTFVTSLAAQQQGPPPSRRDSVVDVLHGIRVPDPYRWLEDQNSAETRAWITAQNAYTQSILRQFSGREKISRRLDELIRTEQLEAPLERNGRYFFRERQKSQDQFVIHMKQGDTDEVLIDPHPMSADHSISVRIMDVSKDGTILAYGIRIGGADEQEIRLFDIVHHHDLADQLPAARYFQVSFKPDSTGLYYALVSNDGPHIRYHAVGSSSKQDIEIFGKGYGPGKIAFAKVSEDGRYLVIQVEHGSAGDRVDVFYQDLKRNTPIKAIVSDIDARFKALAGSERLFLMTNWNAPNSRILAVDLKNPRRERWREVVPENDFAIVDFALAGGKLLVKYLHNVSSQIRVLNEHGQRLGEINFPTFGTVDTMNARWEGNEAFLSFSSFHVPTTVYRYDVTTGTKSEWARVKMPLDSDTFEISQVWFESKDKTRVPMFLLYRRGVKLDGASPVLLIGYGGFNVSFTPRFRPDVVLWVEQGGVFALPNIRGGGEFGEKWHRGGMLANKQNVFDDFLAAADWLVANHYTNPTKLVIRGGSNGGLLVGAAITQRPELFKAAVCSFPLLDMLRYQNFLVAKFWVPEYGSAENSEQMKYLLAYSPYHHVEKGRSYPAVMFASGDFDTRVAPLHARKMAALMQWAAPDSSHLVLLHYDTKSGHSEGRPAWKEIDDTTDELSFLFSQVGMTQ